MPSVSPSARPAASQSNPRRTPGVITLKTWPQRPRPHAAVSRLIDRHGVIPPQNGVVEQIQPEPGAITPEREASGGLVVVGRTPSIDRLPLRPRQSRVVKKQSV